MRWKMKHISSEQWCLKSIALDAWKKKNHLVSCMFKAYKLNTISLISQSNLFQMSTGSLQNRLWKEQIILLSSVLNLMTINKQGRKNIWEMFKNINIIKIKLQDSEAHRRNGNNNRKSYIIKKPNMLPMANSLLSKIPYNNETTV